MARVTTSSSPLMALCLRSCIPTLSLCRRVLNSGGVPSEWESEPLKDIGTGLLGALVLPLLFALIHPSAWNRYSRKFRCRILHSPAPTPQNHPPQTPRIAPAR